MSEHVERLGGRYRLLRPLGQGGMGRVWHAHDELLARDVAVKEVVPPVGMAENEVEVFTSRTLREARAAARISHPGVATVYDVLEERGHPWIIMQFVPSRPLGGLIAERGGLPAERVARIGLDLLRALRAAHAVGVLHRDVKPDNVLLAHDGSAVLTDFGLAALDEDASVTRSGMVVGTPAYMAPERATGGPSLPASDLWSLGALLYAAVEGLSPFHRSHVLATLGAVVHDEPPPMVKAGTLAPVIHGLLRKEPSERMSLDEAEALLLAAVHDGRLRSPADLPSEPVSPASETSVSPSTAARPWRSRLFPAAVAALVVAALTTSLQSGAPATPSAARPAVPPAADVPSDSSVDAPVKAPVKAPVESVSPSPAVRRSSAEPAPHAATRKTRRQSTGESTGENTGVSTASASPRRPTIVAEPTDRKKAQPGKGNKRDKDKGKGKGGR
ncbi:serine/threonine-protein kinase [Nonomuraea roseola]|uniref:non-specific serine/threonine protein kinase n=1 Tax=Nonomuraea roseola TaxID=46179 RepID=A0ABV5Q8C1_9ACTN